MNWLQAEHLDDQKKNSLKYERIKPSTYAQTKTKRKQNTEKSQKTYGIDAAAN